MSQINSLSYYLAFTHIPGLGLSQLFKTLELYPSLEVFFQQDSADLTQLGLNSEQVQAIQNPPWHEIDAEIKWGQQPQQHILTWFDEAYPSQLKEIANAPPLLYVHGDVSLLKQPQIAMVGSRNPTPNGLQLAHGFASELAQRGFVVNSGLALGIDGASHEGALAAKGKTIAVLGTGVDVLYPRRHRALTTEIINHGALVSEFFLGTQAYPTNFPRRNRIISGLSQGVVIVEAALRSGSLITARYANEQGREVFAIPSSINNPLAKGCHHLIRQGAKIVESVQDIIEEIMPQLDLFDSKPNIDNHPLSLDNEQQQLVKCIGFDTMSVDAVVKSSGFSVEKVMALLLELELSGVIKASPGGYQVTAKQ